MTKEEFAKARKILGKTQKQLAQLLGTSLKAVHSYEQGWRHIPLHVERQLYFLLFNQKSASTNRKACWTISHCPPDRKQVCPAWEFNAGNLCWFINGTICQGEVQNSWKEKIEICKTCSVLSGIVEKLHGL
ncbi:MAG: transcriptional regulator [Deltaproteobacteria bacterium]|nr:MAG: transcriptional regulator [Deltaproteobacteria bacterium]